MTSLFPLLLLIASIGSTGFAGSVSAEVVKREPPMGAMKEGEVVLVDDGSCPKGQIKRVVGGNHTKVGGTKQSSERKVA